MPSGGSRARSGPAPDPNALRRERPGDAGWTTLPPRREGVAPVWPLPDQSAREEQLWARFWAKPQAAIWERDALDEQVAIFVRTFAGAELVDSSVALRTLLRQLAGELLLTTPAMYAARVKIGADAVPVAPGVPVRAAKASRSKSRLRVVAADGV